MSQGPEEQQFTSCWSANSERMKCLIVELNARVSQADVSKAREVQEGFCIYIDMDYYED